MKNNPIGVLDSGIGGLSVFLEIKKLLPNEPIMYVCDSKNVPYSTKSDEEILKLASELVKFLLQQKCKLIIVACNTITVSAIDKLRNKFTNISIIGTVPVVKTAAERTKTGKIGIFSTKKTAKSQYQKNLIEKFAAKLEVLDIGSDQIASRIEKGQFGSEFGNILKYELAPFVNSKIDVLALGCTHYPLVRGEIQKVLGSKIQVIDSGEAVARQAKRILENNNLFYEGSAVVYTFYTSGSKKTFAFWQNKLKLGGEIYGYAI